MCVTNTTGRRPLSFSLAQTVLPTTGFPPQQQHQQQQRYPESYSTAPVEKPSPLQFSPSLFSLAQPVVSTESLSSSDANAEKLRPKRRRKPQKPGKTAKNNDRHFVVHEYHDHAFDADDSCDQEDDTYNSNDNTTAAAASTNEEHHRRRRGGVTASFPMKLHEVLDQVVEDGLDHIISWQTHGRCFVIHKPKEFVEWVMPK